MALQPGSKLAAIVAGMRTATPEHNPFTTPDAPSLVPNEETRVALGEASVQLLQGLASLIELYPSVQPDLQTTGAEIDSLLVGMGGVIRHAAVLDAEAIVL